MLPRTLPRARWHVYVAVFTLTVCFCASITATDIPYELLKFQLHRHQQPTTELSHRLAFEQARIRRRALVESEQMDADIPFGELALTDSILGLGYGTHYAEIYLGIPAQSASVIVDTGSHLTALPCITCNGCGQHTDPPFNVSKSTTAKYIACNDYESCHSCEQDRCYIYQNYFEGSMWQAVMVDELVWVGGYLSHSDDVLMMMTTFGFRYRLGCQIQETGLFVTQKENGIMGLGRHHSTVMSYMLKAGRVTHDIFTLCFSDDGGELVFGGVDYSHHTTDVGYTPLLNDNSVAYPVHVRFILVNGVPLRINEKTINSGKGVIIDSGTTSTYFDSRINRSFMKAFRSASGGRDYSNACMKLSNDDLAALPIISIILSGMKGDDSDDVQLDIPASKYFAPCDDGESFYGSFYFSERSGGVLGASAMVGLDVIFDAENKRIGFAESHCGKGHRNASSVSPVIADPLRSKNASTDASVTTEQSNAFMLSSSNNSVANATNVASIDTTTSSSAGMTTQQTSLSFASFIVVVILISLLSAALGVIAWTKWQVRTWSRVPDSSTRARVEMIEQSDESPSQQSCLLAEEGQLSPCFEATTIPQSPKFAMGSSGEGDDI